MTYLNKEENSSWKKLPAIEGTHGGCINCGPRPSFFPLTETIAVGFGIAMLTKGNERVYSEPTSSDEEAAGDDWEALYMTGQQAEDLAAADPDHDWQISLQGPLSGRTYQRHSPGEWALVEQNRGFT